MKLSDFRDNAIKHLLSQTGVKVDEYNNKWAETEFLNLSTMEHALLALYLAKEKKSFDIHDREIDTLRVIVN